MKHKELLEKIDIVISNLESEGFSAEDILTILDGGANIVRSMAQSKSFFYTLSQIKDNFNK